MMGCHGSRALIHPGVRAIAVDLIALEASPFPGGCIYNDAAGGVHDCRQIKGFLLTVPEDS